MPHTEFSMCMTLYSRRSAKYKGMMSTALIFVECQSGPDKKILIEQDKKDSECTQRGTCLKVRRAIDLNHNDADFNSVLFAHYPAPSTPPPAVRGWKWCFRGHGCLGFIKEAILHPWIAYEGGHVGTPTLPSRDVTF